MYLPYLLKEEEAKKDNDLHLLELLEVSHMVD